MWLWTDGSTKAGRGRPGCGRGTGAVPSSSAHGKLGAKESGCVQLPEGMKGLGLSVAIPTPPSAAKSRPAHGLSPPVSPTSGPIGDVECQRRESIRRRLGDHFDLFGKVEDDAIAKEGVSDLVQLVLEGLGDSWSEIRGDTAKALGRQCSEFLPKAVCQELMGRLLSILEAANDTTLPSWQVLHGALIGLYPLLAMAAAPQQGFVQDSCLTLQYHSRLPVREAARKCFGRLLSILPNGLSLSTGLVLQKISDISNNPTTLWRFPPETAATNPSPSPRWSACSSTDISFCLDGLLCCMGVIINSSSGLKEISPTINVISIISNCLGDASSTVRQSAGQNLLSLLRKAEEAPSACEDKGSCLECKHAVYAAILRQLEDRSASKWPQHEASLLVGEDIIRTTTLKLIEANDISDVQIRNPALYELLQVFFGAVAFALQHAKFELRRVGAQLLPPLLRAIVLLAPDILSNTQALEPIIFTAPLSSQTSSLFHCVVISEVAKICQHFREIKFDSTEESLAQQPGHHRWALEVQGRHMEDENRVAFHVAMRKFCLSFTTAIKEERLALLLERSNLVLSLMEALQSQTTRDWPKSQEDTPMVYSCDFIESRALLCALGRCQTLAPAIFTDAWFVATASRRTFDPIIAPSECSVAPPPSRLAHSLMDPSADAKKSGFVAANRWICEAVAPVVPILVAKLSCDSLEVVVDMAPTLVIASWILKSVSDPLWLDRRPAVRRGLFDTLPALLKLSSLRDAGPRQLFELADIVNDAFTACLSHGRKWDTNEMYQLLKLVHSSGPILSSLRGLQEEGGARSAALKSKLSIIRERLVKVKQTKSPHNVGEDRRGAAAHSPLPLQFSPPFSSSTAGDGGLEPYLGGSDDDDNDDERDEGGEDKLDEFSDWDEESTINDEMSASESGLLLNCDVLSIVQDIDAALKLA